MKDDNNIIAELQMPYPWGLVPDSLSLNNHFFLIQLSSTIIFYEKVNMLMSNMKKLLFSLILLSCSQAPSDPLLQEKTLCREAADSILSYMPGWEEVYSCYTNSPFHVGQQEYTKTVLSVIAVKGKDTLEISADEFQYEYGGNSFQEDSAWVGEIGRVYPFEENVSIIKRHNLLMKELFKGVPGFTLEVNNNLIKAKYVKFKPKKPSIPLEEYGLTEDDVSGTEVDSVAMNVQNQ